MLSRIWGRRNPHALLLGMYISITTMENNIEDPQKTENRTDMCSSNTMPRDMPEGI
jgi:hypothetical protein